MIGYPYQYGDINYVSFWEDDNRAFIKTLYIIFALGMLSSNPAFSADAVGEAINVNQTRKITSIALLDAIDAAACHKGKKCVQKMSEKASKNLKIVTAVVCTAAIVWCTRVINERVVNRHL